MRIHTSALIGIAVALTSMPLDLHGQDSRPHRTIMLVALDAGRTPAPAMVHRRVSGDERDVITLTATASPRDLHTAIHLLEVLHARFGDTLSRDIAVSGRVEDDAARTAPPIDVARYATILGQLRSSDRSTLTGFGNVRTLRIREPVRKVAVGNGR